MTAPAVLLTEQGQTKQADAPTVSDPFDIGLTVVTEIGSEQLPQACGTGDGCKASCASSCASAV
ncbi:FxLD family lanthipeptide [Streptomyces sp. NPDC007991]|uniref:FxLD family lanthipeptide n=1 Tax=Streptomyces sp. NPDC007991 TaxID=3364803 RepID=UPI0036ED5D8C